MAIAIFDISGTLHEDRLGAPMYDEFHDLFNYLKQNNISIALATNLSRSGLDHFIQNNRINNMIDEHICMSEAAPKPSTEMLEEILLRTGESAENALMIGDSEGDIAMAQALKVKACAVCWDTNWSSNVLSMNPQYKVEKVADLWQVFQKVFQTK